MDAPTRGEATQALIDLVTRARQLTPDLLTTMRPVLSASDIERIFLAEATIVHILCILLLTVTDMRSQISGLHLSFETLDTHTHALPTTAQILGAVQEGATLPLSNSLHDLSHRMAGWVLSHPTLMMSPQSAGRSTHVPPPRSAQHPRPHLPQPIQLNQGMDPDVPRYDLATKTFYGNPKAYPAKVPVSWKAKIFKEGRYPSTNTFTPGQEDTLWAGPPL